MKKVFISILILMIAISMIGCNKTADNKSSSNNSSNKSTISTTILDEALSNSKYYSDPFSISVGKLVNATMDNYKITYMTGKESIEKGYVLESQVDESIDLDYFYYAVISGDTMVNPDIPYMTEYEEEAVKVWMYFDKNGNLLTSGVELCENLSTCAIIIMTSSIY